MNIIYVLLYVILYVIGEAQGLWWYRVNILEFVGCNRELQLLCYMSNYCSTLKTKTLLTTGWIFQHKPLPTSHSETQIHSASYSYHDACWELPTALNIPHRISVLCGLYIRMVLCRSCPYVSSTTTLMMTTNFHFHLYMSIARRLVATGMGIARWVFVFSFCGSGKFILFGFCFEFCSEFC